MFGFGLKKNSAITLKNGEIVNFKTGDIISFNYNEGNNINELITFYKVSVMVMDKKGMSIFTNGKPIYVYYDSIIELI